MKVLIDEKSAKKKGPKLLVKGHASLFVPKTERAWYNEMQLYVHKRGFSMSLLLRELLKAWDQLEKDAGRKK